MVRAKTERTLKAGMGGDDWPTVGLLNLGPQRCFALENVPSFLEYLKVPLSPLAKCQEQPPNQ